MNTKVNTEVHDLVIAPCRGPLRGGVPSPPDDDLGSLALFFAALAEGTSEIRRLGRGADVTSMSAALRQLGVTIEEDSSGTVRVHGVSLRGLVDPRAPIATGTSERTLVRLASALVAHPFRAVLASTRDAESKWGDERAMTRVASALRKRAAQIEGTFAGPRAGELESPFQVGPLAEGHALSGIELDFDTPGPEVKEALIISGLYADEGTYVRETIVSRDHVERMLQALGLPMRAAGSIALFEAAEFDGKIPAFAFDVPGDISAAIFLLAMGALVRESRVSVRGAGLNPTRTGAIDLFRQMGAGVEVAVSATSLGEIEGTVSVTPTPLRAVPIGGEAWLRARSDLPALAALAARAAGTTEIVWGDHRADAASAAKVAAVLTAFGFGCEIAKDRLLIGGKPDEALRAVEIDTMGDVESAETAVLLALVADGPSTIRHVDALADRFPRFVGTMRALGADVRVEKRTV